MVLQKSSGLEKKGLGYLQSLIWLPLSNAAMIWYEIITENYFDKFLKQVCVRALEL